MPATRRRLLGAFAPLAISTAAGAVAACGGPGQARGGDGAANPAPSGPQRVDAWWSIADSNPSVKPCWDEFMKRHAGWTGELTMGVTYDKYQASVAGGTSPDAYFGSFQQIQAAAYKRLFAPLDQYITRDRVNMDQYFIGSRTGAVYKSKIYGMPHHSNVRSVYINDTVFREAGLDPSKAPATWDDFRVANQRLKREDAPGQLSRIGYNPTWQVGGPAAVLYFQANGVSLMTPDATQVGFATPAGIEALKWLLEAVQALGGPQALSEYQKPYAKGTGEALGKGAAGMAMAGIWVVPRDAMAANPDALISQWPIPGGPSAKGKQFGFVAATSGVVPTSAARPDAGWEFTKFQSSVDGQRFIQGPNGTWDQACIAGVANDPAVLQQQPWRKRANELLSQARSTAYFPHPGAVDVESAMNASVDAMLAGKQGPDATMQDMKQQVQNFMDQYR